MSRSLSRRAVARALVFLLAAPLGLAAGACAGRTVEVGTGGELAPAASVELTNNLTQAVNVYVRSGSGSEVFVRQVNGRSTERVAVRGVREGATVSLRIAPIDGAQNYTRENVTVGQGSRVSVP